MTEHSAFEMRSIGAMARLLAWILAWVATMVLVDKAVLYQWHSSASLSLLGVAVNAALGLGMIWTFIRYLRQMDEMQRQIQLESLALAMGVGLVGSFTYSLLGTAGFITDGEVSDIILLMTGTYVAGTIFGQLRYR